MKKLLTVLLIFAATHAFAQQDPYYTHFKYNTQSYNPAAAGEHLSSICLTGVTHYQWRQYDDVTFSRGTDGSGVPETDIDNVAPETHNLNLNTMFKLGKSGLNFMGAGLSIIDDNVGFTKNTSVMVDLNFKRQFQNGFREIAAGVGLGFQQFGLVNPNYKWRDPGDVLIAAINNGNLSQGKFNMNAGVFFRQKRLGPITNFYGGLSATQLTTPTYQLGAWNRQFVQHWYAMAGGDYEMGNIVLEPAVMVKFSGANRILGQEGFRPQIDLNCTALYADKFRGGLAFRNWGNVDAVSFLLGFKKNQLEIGYSYDLTLSNILGVSTGTHELMVKYCIPIVIVPPTRTLILTPRFL